jgi:hypothetical protein
VGEEHEKRHKRGSAHGLRGSAGASSSPYIGHDIQHNHRNQRHPGGSEREAEGDRSSIAWVRDYERGTSAGQSGICIQGFSRCIKASI